MPEFISQQLSGKSSLIMASLSVLNKNWAPQQFFANSHSLLLYSNFDCHCLVLSPHVSVFRFISRWHHIALCSADQALPLILDSPLPHSSPLLASQAALWFNQVSFSYKGQKPNLNWLWLKEKETYLRRIFQSIIFYNWRNRWMTKLQEKCYWASGATGTVDVNATWALTHPSSCLCFSPWACSIPTTVDHSKQEMMAITSS